MAVGVAGVLLNDFFAVRLSSWPRVPNKAQRTRFRNTLLPIQTYTERQRGAFAR